MINTLLSYYAGLERYNAYNKFREKSTLVKIETNLCHNEIIPVLIICTQDFILYVKPITILFVTLP